MRKILTGCLMVFGVTMAVGVAMWRHERHQSKQREHGSFCNCCSPIDP